MPYSLLLTLQAHDTREQWKHSWIQEMFWWQWHVFFKQAQDRSESISSSYSPVVFVFTLAAPWLHFKKTMRWRKHGEKRTCATAREWEMRRRRPGGMKVGRKDERKGRKVKHHPLSCFFSFPFPTRSVSSWILPFVVVYLRTLSPLHLKPIYCIRPAPKPSPFKVTKTIFRVASAAQWSI